MTWINRLYIFFLGIILTITTGFGIAAFYPEPVYPQYSAKPATIIPQSCIQTPASSQTPDCQKYLNDQQMQQTRDQEEFQKKQDEYNNQNAGYTRTAIFFGIAIGTFFVLVGISLIKKSKLVANGLLLAGVLTAIFTRLLISLASLGVAVSATETNTVGYIEFGILLLLSISVVFVGLNTLTENK
jgi:hypothetical protein